VTGSDLEVTYLSGSHFEVAVKGQKLASTVYFSSYKAVARSRRESHDKKLRMTSGEWK